jgi:hypothetical protein
MGQSLLSNQHTYISRICTFHPGAGEQSGFFSLLRIFSFDPEMLFIQKCFFTFDPEMFFLSFRNIFFPMIRKCFPREVGSPTRLEDIHELAEDDPVLERVLVRPREPLVQDGLDPGLGPIL